MSEHIRIGDVAPRVNYAADGVQTAFTFPFPIFATADLEVRVDGLRQSSGFSISGTGESEGGRLLFAVPPAAGARITLLRRMRIARTTDFQENGVLRARTLNDELDYQVAALQELRDELSGAVRLDLSETSAMTLPRASARANRVLAFDSIGDVTVLPQTGLITGAHPGAVPRTVEDKLAEALSVRDFGATGNGTTDDGPALQAAMSAAAGFGRRLVIGEGTFRTSQPLTLPGEALGLTMLGLILYAGPAGSTALTIGNGGTYRTATRSYLGLRVQRAAISTWLDENDIGIKLINLDACHTEVRQVEGFTIGIQTLGDGRGYEDSTMHLGRIVNNRYGMDVRCETAAGWNNAITYVGGHFANASATHPALSRFGVRFSAAPGAYDRHNQHLFLGPAFELQRQGTPGTVEAIPFLIEAEDARCIMARGIRMEQCSNFVARHFGGPNDCLYEIGYNGTYGFVGLGVDYAPGATRAGGTVIALHQATAAHGTPRLVAAAEHLRSRAFRQTVDSAGGIGFEEMALLSSNPNGPPTDLNGFCFAGLSQLTLHAETVGLPTSRALAFVVDSADCKEFFLAAEGGKLRPVVMQFDALENVLGDEARLLFSNMNAVFAGSPSYWWEGNANLDSLSGGIALNRLQRITLDAGARYAAIGVRGGSADAMLRSLRLFTGAQHAPPLIYGGPRRWGVREYTVTDSDWNVPTLSPGDTATRDVTLPGLRQGDMVQAGFAKTTGFQNGGVVFHAAVGGTASTNQVRVTAQNISGGTITVGEGALIVRAVKPKM